MPSVKVEKEIARQKRLRNISYRLLRADWHEEPDENWKERACMWEEGHAAKTHREGPACTMEPRGTAAGGRI